MGLDNGFVVKKYRGLISSNELPSGLTGTLFEDLNDATPKQEIDIVYWRKNWGLRDAIIAWFGGENNTGVYLLERPEDIESIIDIIFTFLDREKWEEEGHSIWTFDEIKSNLMSSIINLILIERFMETHHNVYVEFYDSY